ncbi:hypothetical protein ACQ4LE_004303 [Meloidogyne hapla]
MYKKPDLKDVTVKKKKKTERKKKSPKRKTSIIKKVPTREEQKKTGKHKLSLQSLKQIVSSTLLFPVTTYVLFTMQQAKEIRKRREDNFWYFTKRSA